MHYGVSRCIEVHQDLWSCIRAYQAVIAVYRPYALTSRLHNNDAMLGVKTCRAACTCCAGRALALSWCAGPGQPGGMACRGWPAGCMLGDGARDSASFDPQHAGAPFCDVICIRSNAVCVCVITLFLVARCIVLYRGESRCTMVYQGMLEWFRVYGGVSWHVSRCNKVYFGVTHPIPGPLVVTLHAWAGSVAHDHEHDLGHHDLCDPHDNRCQLNGKPGTLE